MAELMKNIVIGFECEFVERPPEIFQCECPICLNVLREPHQVTCCGKSFCKECITRVKDNERSCPCCNQEGFKDYPNKGLQQPLYGFQVYCTNKEEGCDWKGELGQLDRHLNMTWQETAMNELEGCQAVKVECSYCHNVVTRNELLQHKNELCLKRPFTCEFCCDYKSTVDDVTKHHWFVCGCHPVECPNKCGAMPQRQESKSHVENDCPLTVVDCDFNYAGCEVRSPRKDMPTHLRDELVTHFSLLALNQKQQLEKIQELSEEIAVLKSSSAIVPVHFVLDNPTQYTSEKQWSSPHFFSHYHGYKLSLRVYKSSIHTAGFSFDSIEFHAFLLQGEFDDKLKWPFRGTIKIKMLKNSKQDAKDMETIDVENGERVKEENDICECGVAVFLYDKMTQHLDSSCLHIMINVDF